jgi:ribosomal protein S27AE
VLDISCSWLLAADGTPYAKEYVMHSTLPTSTGDRPTLVSGLRGRETSKGSVALASCDAAGRTDEGASLQARCVQCGAGVHDWRRLLGVGATVEASAPGSALVTHPNACPRCGSSTVVVSASGRIRTAA